MSTTMSEIAGKVDQDYRELVGQMADEESVEPAEVRQLLMLAGRSAGQLAADVERFRKRRQCAADLDEARRLAKEIDAAKPELAKARATLEAVTRSATAEYEQAVREAAERRDQAIGEAQTTVNELASQINAMDQQAATLRNGRWAFLCETTMPSVEAEIRTLQGKRQPLQELMTLGQTSTEEILQKAEQAEAEADLIDKQVDAYLAFGTMDQEKRIALLAVDSKMQCTIGGSGESCWNFRTPTWIGLGWIESYRDRYLSAPTPEKAARGRKAAEDLRAKAQVLRRQIAHIEATRPKLPSITAQVEKLDAEIAGCRRKKRAPEYFALSE